MHTKKEEVENKNVWKELRNLGLLPFPRLELHGFTTEKINSYFLSSSISPNKEYLNAHNVIYSASTNGFPFYPVRVNKVILVVPLFKSQIKGEDGIPKIIIAKVFSSIAPQLVCVFNESFEHGIFPTASENSQTIALKKSQYLHHPISALSFCCAFYQKY